jgi:hypothetical protein
MILLHASGNSCAGCERENIALRNTAAFAACNDPSLISRTEHDWKGIMCSHVTEDSLKNCPSGDVDNDSDHGDQDGGDDQGARAAPKRRSSRQIEEDARWKQHRDDEMTRIQDHFYRLKSKLLSCTREQFPDRAARVDAHIVAAFRELADVQDVPQSTIAARFQDDPKRTQRPKTPPSKRAATPAGGSARTSTSAPAGGGAARVSAPPASHTSVSVRNVVYVFSDSDDVRELLEGGASSSE